jgi:hypothetical protein
MIQVITNRAMNSSSNIIVSKFNEYKSFTNYDINLIMLNDDSIWRKNANTTSSIDITSDLYTIKKSIGEAKEKHCIIVFPKNYIFKYHHYSGSYMSSIALKDSFVTIKNTIDQVVGDFKFGLIFGEIESNLNGSLIKSDFTFSQFEENFEKKILSISNGVTTIQKENIILTTSDLSSEKEIFDFFIEMKLVTDGKEDVPEWIGDFSMFNDEKLNEKLQLNNTAIFDLQKENKQVQAELAKNLEYKSILYTSGDELAAKVFEIIEEITGLSLQDFEDKKNEDFYLMSGNLQIVGEIKGVGANVQQRNLTQLEHHAALFLEKNSDIDRNDLKKILIINHQRTKPLDEREEIHNQQIDDAIRYEVLIVETITLLKILEKYKNGELTQEQCLDYFINSKPGLLEI